MLSQKLLAPLAVSADYPVKYVGGYVQAILGTTADVTISLTGLTGGLASAPAANDLVVVYFAVGSAASYDLIVAGYKEVFDLYQMGNSTQDANLAFAYKFMDTTPDTSFLLTNGTSNSLNAGAVAVQVFRNVNPFSFASVIPSSAQGLVSGAKPNPPGITPIIANSVVLAGGMHAYSGTVGPFVSSDLTNFISVGSNDTYDCSVGAGYYRWTSGTFDPAVFTGGGSSSSAWAASTAVIEPINNTVEGLIGTTAATRTSNSSGSSLVFSRPLGTQPGDLLVVLASLTANSNSLCTLSSTLLHLKGSYSVDNRALYVGARIAEATDPDTYSINMSQGGDGNAMTADGILLCYRGRTIDSASSLNFAGSPLGRSVTLRQNNSTVLGLGLSDISTVFTQTSYFSNNKIAIDETAPGYTVFNKDGVATGATGDVTFSVVGGGTAVSAMLMGLKPVSVTANAVRVVDTNSTASGATSISIPSNKAGDIILLIRVSSTSTPPALLTGYTNLGTFTGSLGGRAQYKVSDGTAGSVTVTGYAAVAIIRGASAIGQTAFRSSSTAQTTVTLPTISNLTQNVRNLVLGGTAYSVDITGSNYEPIVDFGAAINGPTPASISDATVTQTSRANAAWVIEFLP